MIRTSLTLIALIALARPFDPEPPRIPSSPGLYLTVYDWALGGANCDSDCSNTALTTTGPELYGWTAACPSAWLGYVATTIVTIWGVDFWCIDALGLPTDRVLTEIDGRRVYRIDIAFAPADLHPWNQEYVPAGQWTTRRQWMTEFYLLREAMTQ